jgi:2-iminobutanoate/2-iminopropanoate deaminase
MTSERREQVTHGTAIEDLFGYSTGMAIGSLVYVAGQLARDDTGTQISATDLDSKLAQVVKNIQSVVERMGSSLDEVAYLQIHVTNEVDDLKDAFAVCKKHFGSIAPAMTIVPVERLNDDGGLVEVSAVAVRS